MKPIEFEVDEIPQSADPDEEGNYQFYIYCSNMSDGDYSNAIETIQKLWDLETEVSLKVNIKLKDVYNDLFDMYNAEGKINEVDVPLFETLRKDCQWIIDEIDKLEKNT